MKVIVNKFLFDLPVAKRRNKLSTQELAFVEERSKSLTRLVHTRPDAFTGIGYADGFYGAFYNLFKRFEDEEYERGFKFFETVSFSEYKDIMMDEDVNIPSLYERYPSLTRENIVSDDFGMDLMHAYCIIEHKMRKEPGVTVQLNIDPPIDNIIDMEQQPDNELLDNMAKQTMIRNERDAARRQEQELLEVKQEAKTRPVVVPDSRNALIDILKGTITERLKKENETEKAPEPTLEEIMTSMDLALRANEHVLEASLNHSTESTEGIVSEIKFKPATDILHLIETLDHLMEIMSTMQKPTSTKALVIGGTAEYTSVLIGFFIQE